MKDLKRCPWPADDKLMIAYHDKEWGVPLHNDKKLFEFLVLETFQAGLSWRTVLYKRENFRKAFDNFDFNKVAKYKKKEFNRLINDAGIIRNKLKINDAITNAQAFLDIRKEFGTFKKYIWGFVNNKPIKNKWKRSNQLPARTKLSDEISLDLKSRGFKFVGSTIIYAHMQATGMVNDHLMGCFRYQKL
ncbi:MAG TPA: DNA-3-methyladenine glycosylase I [bacterium]|nr:DNA-3-methyladenine glycosylase I [bacterium]